MLSDDPEFINVLLNKTSGEKFIFHNEANQILVDFFAVLIFASFVSALPGAYSDGTKEGKENICILDSVYPAVFRYLRPAAF